MKFKIVLTLVFTGLVASPSLSFALSNYGHRGGAGHTGYYEDLAENSIEALRVALTGRDGTVLQDHSKFAYLEFDIRETYDNRLIVSHDETLDRTIDWPNSPQDFLNKILRDSDVLNRHGKQRLEKKDLRVNKMTLDEIQMFRLKNGQEPMPSFESYLEAIEVFGIRKPIAVEVKQLDTDIGRQRFLDILNDFNERYFSNVIVKYEKKFDFVDKLSVISFPGSFRESFGKVNSAMRKFWCQEFRGSGFSGMYMPIFHTRDHCFGQYFRIHELSETQQVEALTPRG